MENYVMDLRSYEENLLGGLNNHEEVVKEIEEMKTAKVGTLKPNCWKKVSENEFEIFAM